MKEKWKPRPRGMHSNSMDTSTGGARALTRMTSARVSDDLETLFGAGAVGRLSDAELLERFRLRDDVAPSDAAFAELLARHGPMVMGVCKRVVGNSQVAADAFQAVFLVLVRKAAAVRVEDSLGRWLYGVSVRVARRARRTALADRARERNLDGVDRAGGDIPVELCERAELRAVIDEEIDRLPSRYRSAVECCYLEGLTHEQAARRLCCPIGTVESRLHRARERLRSRLARRGLKPTVGIAAWLCTETARAEVPEWLAAGTTSIAARGSIGPAPGGAGSAAVSALVNETIRRMMMVSGFRVGLLVLAIGLPTATAVGLSAADGSGAKKTALGASVPPGRGTGQTEPTMADRFARIKAEYRAQQDAVSHAVEKAKNQREINEIYTKMSPDEVAFTRRMVDLATSSPKDPVARDALVWVVDKPGMWKVGEYGDEFGRAAALLVRHHGDDPEAVRVGLGLDNIVSHHTDQLLAGFYAAAKGHEAKGLARLALAQYLEAEAKFTTGTRAFQERQKNRFLGVIGDDGKLGEKETEQSDEEYAYIVQLRLRDADVMRKLAERLYSEVVAEYSDVLHHTVKHRELEALLNSPKPTWNGKPLTPEELVKLKEMVEGKRTLADAARGAAR